MENHRSLNRGVTLLARHWRCLLLATARARAAPAKLLKGPEIIAAFEGKTVTGAYARRPRLPRKLLQRRQASTYWDPRASSAGTWSVVNNLFCTFYTSMTGGCFASCR